jgi:hypothetical protein
MHSATFAWYKWTDLKSIFTSYDINLYNVELALLTDKCDDMFRRKLANIKSDPDILGRIRKILKSDN